LRSGYRGSECCCNPALIQATACCSTTPAAARPAIAAEGGFAQPGLELAKSRSIGLKSPEYALEAEAALFGALKFGTYNSAAQAWRKPILHAILDRD
jgi:hypothetical protein